MNSTTYPRKVVNPYQKSHSGHQNDSLGSILAGLVAASQSLASSSNTEQQWEQLGKALQNCVDQWNLDHAKTLLGWVQKQVELNQNDRHVARSLGLLATAMRDFWGMQLVYALSCPFETKKCPFDFLTRLSGDSARSEVQSASCVCLAVLWDTLCRLDRLASPTHQMPAQQENSWWITCMESPFKAEKTASISIWDSVNQWCIGQWMDTDFDMPNGDQEAQDGTIGKETRKQAACILMNQFLGKESTSTWFYTMSDDKWCKLTERLIEQSQRLLDPNMPMTSYARLSLVCLHLLAKLERTAGREMPHTYEKLVDGSGSGGLITTMMKSTLQTSSEDCPRWIEDASALILPILNEWSQAGALLPYWEMDARSEIAREFTKEITERIMGGNIVKSTKLASFLWLLRETPALCWNVMHACVPKGKWVDFVASVATLTLCENQSEAPLLACLLREILQLWTSYRNDELLQQKVSNLSFLSKLSEHASSMLRSDENKALLLLHIDCLKVLCASQGYQTSESLRAFAQRLLPVIACRPFQVERDSIVRYDSDSSMDSGESTPTANNLSRLDASYIVPDETSTTAPSKAVLYGLESCLRISAASIVASCIDKNSVDFESQANRALTEFLSSSDMVLSVENMERVSRGCLHRRLSLLRILATRQDESFFTDAFLNIELAKAREIRQSLTETARLSDRITWFEKREKQLSNETKTLEARIHRNSATAQRECDVIFRKLVNESKQALNAEIAKRTEQQQELVSLREANAAIKKAVQEFEMENNTLRKISSELEADLSEKVRLQHSLENQIDGFDTSLNQERARVARLTQELEVAHESINVFKTTVQNQRDQIVQNEDTIERLDASRAEMHANLESLFGDMVSLAHAYEIKEKEISSGNESKAAMLEKLEKELDKEKQRRKDMEDKYRQVEYENEALSRKYERAREKLNEERRRFSRSQVSEVSLNRGETSKSYIQQLQLSKPRHPRQSSSRSRQGKENEPALTAGSIR